jgi:prepilin-type N-terminal cleavage/methylation domain-containing protein
MSNKRAFTLIELFVVITIIAILAAIIFPIFAQAREKAKANRQPQIHLFLEVPSVVRPGERVEFALYLLNENLHLIRGYPIFLTCDGGNFISGFRRNDEGEEVEVWYSPQMEVTLSDGGLYGGKWEWRAPSTPGWVRMTAQCVDPERGQVVSTETRIWVSDAPDQHMVEIPLHYDSAYITSNGFVLTYGVFCEPEYRTFHETETILVHLTDAQGNPVGGETVELQTTLGEFSQEFGLETGTAVIRSQQVFLTTDEFGGAAVTFLPPTLPGIATITATTSRGQARITYVFPAVEGIHLRADSYHLARGGESTSLTAKLYDASGTPLGGRRVTFQTTRGQLSAREAITDEEGKASVTLTSDETEGVAVVTASAEGYSDWIFVQVGRIGTYSPSPQYSSIILDVSLSSREVRPSQTGPPNTIPL